MKIWKLSFMLNCHTPHILCIVPCVEGSNHGNLNHGKADLPSVVHLFVLLPLYYYCFIAEIDFFFPSF